MRLSRLAECCRGCFFVDTCEHKMMEALGYLTENAQKSSLDAAAPVLRETTTIYIDGEPALVYKDDLIKELQKSLYGNLGLMRGG